VADEAILKRRFNFDGRAAALALVLLASPGLADGAPRVVSLDQCADQYVMALSPRAAIVGVSMRSGDPDSYLHAQAAGLPRRRASAEAVLAAQPNVVVRYWGGDAPLSRTLARHGVTVVDLTDEGGFDGVRRNIRAVAAALHEGPRGEQLIAVMNAKLAASSGAWRNRPAIYLTPAGFSTGPGTLIDAMLRGAGLDNRTTSPGYASVPMERLVIDPPIALVLGFFDSYGMSQQLWAPGRRSLVRRMVDERAIANLPGAVLDCPAWFAADGVRAISQARR
jgi:iron complex transport system substrate-binding protein